jgi:hypothetical protein
MIEKGNAAILWEGETRRSMQLFPNRDFNTISKSNRAVLPSKLNQIRTVGSICNAKYCLQKTIFTIVIATFHNSRVLLDYVRY